MKKVLIATTICTAMLASCGQNSAEYKKLKAENDSLRIENTKSNAEMDEILGTLNDVEADIQSIRDAENYLNIQQQKGDLNKSNREQIKENMQLISETLKKNKQQISELEEKLKKKAGRIEERVVMIELRKGGSNGVYVLGRIFGVVGG